MSAFSGSFSFAPIPPIRPTASSILLQSNGEILLRTHPELVFEQTIKIAIVAEAAVLALGNRKAAQDGCFSFEDG
nr:hypothetical protein [Paenibacillus ginsengarvi]